MPKTTTTLPVTPPGITPAAAYQALDAIGLPFFFDVPQSGLLHSAMYYDLDDEGLQVDLWLFNAPPTPSVDNLAMTLENGDAFKVIGVLQFTSFRDAANLQISEVTAAGRGYNVPAGRIWAQAQAQGALNLAKDNLPAFSITILPD